MNVKLARIKIGLTQEELCKILKISKSTLLKIERGDFSSLRYPLMIKISEVLKLSVQELFFEK